jgi:hypothetical protein
MFEKEAEEYVKAFTDRSHIWSNDKLMQLQLREAYKDGTEFGYNKANEWHYVKDGLPKDEKEYFVIYESDHTKYIGIESYYLDTKEWSTICKIIAWKEIVLPKEIKEND